MRKLQQHIILKFNSDRLKDYKFKIKTLTLDQARLNGEVIQISDSQLVRTIYEITNRNFSQLTLDTLSKQKKKLSKKKNDKAIRQQLSSINKQMDDLLFIPELISIKFQDKRHFQNLTNKGGVILNGETYVFLMASAGQTRRDTALFVNENIKKQLINILENGRDKSVPLVPAKFMAYLSLYSSSSLAIRFPRIAVVKDVLINATKKVDFSYYISLKDDPIFVEEEKDFQFNGADGQGIMSPEFAESIAQDLQLDYIPASVIIRAPFIKGLLVTFSIAEFAERIAKKDTLVDIYGNIVNVKDIDCIISESQFKLWNCYKDTQEYISQCEKNNLGFGVSRVSPKRDRHNARSSYQFLQVLDLKDDKAIEDISSPTVKWLKDVSGGEFFKSILFLIGNGQSFEDGWFNRLSPMLQSILLENELINDTYFINYIDNALSKKKNDCKFGRLMFEGSYQFAIADPYAQISVIMGMGLTPLLNDGEHYSEYWRNKNVESVIAIRSPIVHSSEVDCLNFKNTYETEYWFRFLNSGIVLPLYGISMDCAILGGQDHDGDSVCTIHNDAFRNGRIENTLPIMYDVRKPEKIEINDTNEEVLVQAQIKQVGTNKIGYFTNLGSSLYALLYNFEPESIEYKTILNRLKYFRVLQGNLIDSTKGISVDPPLLYWDKYTKIKDDMNTDAIEQTKLNNSILGNVRPYFMRYLYSHFRKRYNQEISNYNNISITRFGVPFSQLPKEQVILPEMQILMDTYKRRTYFIDNDSPMNRICHHMEKELKDIKFQRRESASKFDFTILLSKGFRKPLKRDLDKAFLLFKEYKSLKRSLLLSNDEYSEKDFSTIEQVYKYINHKGQSTISSNLSELTDIMIYLCYNNLGKQSRSFVWNCFGQQISDNIREKKNQRYVRMPIPDPKGTIEYLFEKYAVHLINIE